ncbi:MAG: hypothetical protein RIC55_31785 [Pirellulaceae bacterium]
MPIRLSRFLLAIATILASSTVCAAAQPLERLLPDTTRASFSISNAQHLEDGWSRTRLSQLVDVPAMKPFLDDAEARFRRALGGLDDLADIDADDLRAAASGEIRLATVESAAGSAEVAALVDVTGKSDAVAELAAKIDAGLSDRGATHATETIAGATLHTYTWTAEGSTRRTSYFVKNEVLCVASDGALAKTVLARFDGAAGKGLADVPAYRDVIDRCLAAEGDASPQVQWFVQPLELQRLLTEDDQEFERKHGLDGVKAVGGTVRFGVGQFDAVARLAVYAPPPRTRALRLLSLKDDKPLEPQSWLIEDIDSYATANLEFTNVLDDIGPLFDDLAADGIDGTFEDILGDLKDEEVGPGVDIRKELMPILGPRITIVSDHLAGARSDGGVSLIAIETSNEAKAADVVKRLMRDDPQVTRITLPGYPFDLWQVADDPDATMPNMGIVVANGHVLAASHADLIRKILLAPADAPKLAAAADYKQAAAERDSLGGAPLAVWMFSRTRRDYRTTYEMVRAGKLDEMESMYADGLRRLFGHDEERLAGMPRLDFTLLPAFSVVEPFLKPVGALVYNQPTGWMVVAFVGK